MTVWYAIVFVIIACASKDICLYDSIVIWFYVHRAGLDIGRGPMSGTYASVYDNFMYHHDYVIYCVCIMGEA